MANKNRLIKVILSEALHMNLLGSVIVGQHADTIIVERPAAKERKPRTTAKRAPRANAKSAAAAPATLFPPVGEARG